jgi:hypothetical protein
VAASIYARALLGAGFLAYWQGNGAEACRQAEAAPALARAAGETHAPMRTRTDYRFVHIFKLRNGGQQGASCRFEQPLPRVYLRRILQQVSA